MIQPGFPFIGGSFYGEQQLALDLDAPPFPARITQNWANGTYSWMQLVPFSNTTYAIPATKFSGNGTAFESSGNTEVPVGMVVQLSRGVYGGEQYYQFSFSENRIEAEITGVSSLGPGQTYSWQQIDPSSGGWYSGPLSGNYTVSPAVELNDHNTPIGARVIMYRGYSSGLPQIDLMTIIDGNATTNYSTNMTITSAVGGSFNLTVYNATAFATTSSITFPVTYGQISAAINATLVANATVTPISATIYNITLTPMGYGLVTADAAMLQNQNWFFTYGANGSGSGGNTTYNNYTFSNTTFNNATSFNATSVTFGNVTFNSTSSNSTSFSAINITFGSATINNTTITSTNTTWYGQANYAIVKLTGGGTSNGTYNYTLIEGCQNHTFSATGQAYELNGVQGLRANATGIQVVAFKFPSGEIGFDHCCNGSTSSNSSFPQPINRIYLETNATLLSNTSVALGMLLQTRNNFDLEIKRATGTPALTLQNPLLSYYGDPNSTGQFGALPVFDVNNGTFGILDPPSDAGLAAISNLTLPTGLDYRTVPNTLTPVSSMDNFTGLIANNGMWVEQYVPTLRSNDTPLTNPGTMLAYDIVSENWGGLLPTINDGDVLQVDTGHPLGLSYGGAKYSPGNDANWVDPQPTTVAVALDRLAAAIGPVP